MEEITFESLYLAWRRFRRGKSAKADVMEFELNLEGELLSLWADLNNGAYRHGAYQHFRASDPKPRTIHKPRVRDRVLHQWIYDQCLESFEKRYMFHAYAARKGKGTHRAVRRIWRWCRKESRNFIGPVYILHGDVSKYFENMDHGVLRKALEEFGVRGRIRELFREVIASFSTNLGKGIPLGNLTSQLFANVYLHRFDGFVKQVLRTRFYLRYNDDFFIISADKAVLRRQASEARRFLKETLFLDAPADKVSIRSLRQGADVLGYVLFEYGAVARKRTQRRIGVLLSSAAGSEQIQTSSLYQKQKISYWGLLSLGRNFLRREELIYG